jgi:hypothetical protein
MTTISHADLSRAIGQMEGAQKAMEKRMDHLEKAMADGFDKMGNGLEKIDQRLAKIEQAEGERKGAWKVVALLAGVVGAFAGALVKYFMG